MDKLDITIIREMSQAQTMLPAKVGLRSSYREMAKKLSEFLLGPSETESKKCILREFSLDPLFISTPVFSV
jgi:hypothetical protein